MSTVNQDELKAIKVLKFTGKESEWDHSSESLLLWPEQEVLQGYSWVQRRHPEHIDRKKEDHSYELTEAERKEKKRLRQANDNAYINLQLSCEEIPYDLVSLAKTEELPDGCTRDA